MNVSFSKTLRLSETISPFGVGALVDISGNSLIAMDASWWPERSPLVSCERLERTLRVSSLKSAPSVPSFPSKSTPGLTFLRFPAWLFCQNCRAMKRSTPAMETSANPRHSCGGMMVPMRFVAVCESGSHVMDIQWHRWAHRHADAEEQKRCQSEVDLKFKSSSTGNEGLSSLSVRCSACGASRHLGELSGKGVLSRDGFKCEGRQPWQARTDVSECDSPVQAVQRGATNIHTPEVISAIDIPEESPLAAGLAAKIREHPDFEDFASDPFGPLAERLVERVARQVGVEASLVHQLASQPTPGPLDLLEVREDLLDGEWAAFQRSVKHPGSVDTPYFITSPRALTSTSDAAVLRDMGALMGDVVLVERLREVRAMWGYRRYSADASLIPVNFNDQTWFPAVESFGEGIFFELDELALSKWESTPSVVERVKTIERRRRNSPIASRHAEVTPRAVLLHTFSHLVMRRLSFESGYASASLRERVYSSFESIDRQAGILIFTAAGDTEGTLGGLVRQGEPPKLARLLLSAIQDADTCSNDPVCRESEGQGMNALNLAACHGCCLSSETSCERSNLFLDRSMVVGSVEQPGFFDAILDGARRS